VMSLLQAFGSATEPSFGTIGPAYNRMLAIALLLAGAFISMALMERMLGGPRGAGWEVLPRTLACCMAAFVGMGIVQYGAHYANLLATAWNNDFFGSNALLASKVGAIYSGPITTHQALGSAGGMIVVAILTVLTGVSIWKPVQLGWLTDLFGGYDIARDIHFILMSLIVGFLLVHLSLVVLFPRTLLSMLVELRRDTGARPLP